MTEILNAIDMASSTVQSISSEQNDDNTSLLLLTITVRDRLHLAGVIRRIKTIPNVTKITRKR